MKKSYEIDYHAKDIRRQLSQLIDNDSVVGIMDVTIRFVTEMLAFDINYCNDAGVVLLYNENELALTFLFGSSLYENKVEDIRLKDEVRQFFEYYYDEISHECSHGEDRLIFRLTLLPEKEMTEKYFKALDKQKKR